MARGRSIRACAIALVVLAGAPGRVSAQEVSLRVTAGLDGTARAGRWVPVAVTIENRGTPVSGRLVATLDGREAVRELHLAAPARERVEMHLRAPDAPDAVVQVRFLPGHVQQSAPLRIVSWDTPFTLCVSAAGLTPVQESCTATIDATAVPAHWQGLDAADALVWAAGAAGGLTPAQHRAAARLQAMRAWNASTAMAPARPLLPTQEGARPAAGLLALLAGSLAAVALAGRRLGRRPAAVYAALLAAITLGGAGILADGRLGDSAALDLRETVLIRGGAGSAEADISARGLVRFPAAGTFALETTAVDDAELTVKGAATTTASAAQVDEGASAQVSAAKHGAIQYEVEGFLPLGPVAVTRGAGGLLTLENRTGFPLRGCSGSTGVTIAGAPDVAAEGTLSLSVAPDADDPTVTCGTDAWTPTLRSPGRRVRHRTAALLVVDLRSGGSPR
ncbi:MAG TPA: hypothetical protein VM364_23165 [Vicinamibacterales bacterium]|nr:hypothetical protein [Vicinamibacterales bacterium]